MVRTRPLRHSNSNARINQCLPLSRDDGLLGAVHVVSGREGRAAGRGAARGSKLLHLEGGGGRGVPVEPIVVDDVVVVVSVVSVLGLVRLARGEAGREGGS